MASFPGFVTGSYLRRYGSSVDELIGSISGFPIDFRGADVAWLVPTSEFNTLTSVTQYNPNVGRKQLAALVDGVPKYLTASVEQRIGVYRDTAGELQWKSLSNITTSDFVCTEVYNSSRGDNFWPITEITASSNTTDLHILYSDETDGPDTPERRNFFVNGILAKAEFYEIP